MHRMLREQTGKPSNSEERAWGRFSKEIVPNLFSEGRIGTNSASWGADIPEGNDNPDIRRNLDRHGDV